MNDGEKRIIKREVAMAQLNFLSGTCIAVVSYLANTTNESWYTGIFVIFALITGFISIVNGVHGYFRAHQTIEWLKKELCSKE